jgi:hypothetical protein
MGKGHTGRGASKYSPGECEGGEYRPMWPEGNEGKLASPGVAVCGESRTHGDNGGDGETGRKVPRSVPTHLGGWKQLRTPPRRLERVSVVIVLGAQESRVQGERPHRERWAK